MTCIRSKIRICSEMVSWAYFHCSWKKLLYQKPESLNIPKLSFDYRMCVSGCVGYVMIFMQFYLLTMVSTPYNDTWYLVSRPDVLPAHRPSHWTPVSLSSHHPSSPQNAPHCKSWIFRSSTCTSGKVNVTSSPKCCAGRLKNELMFSPVGVVLGRSVGDVSSRHQQEGPRQM